MYYYVLFISCFSCVQIWLQWIKTKLSYEVHLGCCLAFFFFFPFYFVGGKLLVHVGSSRWPDVSIKGEKKGFVSVS